MTDHTGPLYTENETELLWPIRWDTLHDEYQTRQLSDWLYRCNLCQNRNWTVMTNRTGCSLSRKVNRRMTWLIIQVWSPHNIITNCQDWLEILWHMTKTRHDNDMIDHKGLLYVENKTKLLWLIQQGMVYDEH